MNPKITAVHERVDDIPVLVALLLKLRVAEFIDKHFPTNGNRTGLIPSCNSWSKKDIRGSIELLVSRSTGWGESQKRLPTCRLRGLMSGSSSVQRPGVSGAGR